MPLGIAHRHRHRRRARRAGRRRSRDGDVKPITQVLDAERVRAAGRRRAGALDGRVLRGRRRRHDYRRCCRRRRAAAAPTRTRRCAWPRSRAAGLGGDSTARRGADGEAARSAGAARRRARRASPTPELAARGIAADVVARLAARGLVSLRARARRPRSVRRAPSMADGRRRSGPRALTLEQAAALERCARWPTRATFRVALLHGVTGSGKTEIYLRLAAAVRARGPPRADARAGDRADAGRRRARSAQAFGERVAIQHSGLSDGERHDQWQRIRRGDVDVVVGTRSAVFAPLERVGLIVVDEEHDGSYKQEESPRYNGRDVAIVRGAARGRARRARLGDAVDGELPQRDDRQVRARRARAPRARSAARRGDASSTCARSTPPTGPDVDPEPRAARRRSRARSTRREQVARAAQPPRLRDGRVLPAVRRHARLPELQRVAGRPRRGHGAARALPLLQLHGARADGVPAVRRRRISSRPASAPSASRRKSQRACPGARVARLDRDAIRRKGALTALLARFRDGEIDVLVGTQMIAKGHDFPRVTLVGVVSADVGLGLADFRASERTFQLLTQVAGRAGRGEQPGEAIVQTLYPDHYSIQLACRQDYPAFYERELQFRRAMRYPPLVSLDQRRRPRAHVRRRDGRCGGYRAAAAGRRRAQRPARARPGAGAARQAARRVPRAVPDQGHATASGCAKRCRPRSPRGRSCSAASSSTSIR